MTDENKGKIVDETIGKKDNKGVTDEMNSKSEKNDRVKGVEKGKEWANVRKGKVKPRAIDHES